MLLEHEGQHVPVVVRLGVFPPARVAESCLRSVSTHMLQQTLYLQKLPPWLTTSAPDLNKRADKIGHTMAIAAAYTPRQPDLHSCSRERRQTGRAQPLALIRTIQCCNPKVSACLRTSCSSTDSWPHSARHHTQQFAHAQPHRAT